MHSIIYGRNQVEKDVYKKRSSRYSSEERLSVTSKSSLTEALSTIKYKPFFNDRWFIHFDVDKLPEDVFLESLKLLKHPNVECYFSIDRDGKLYSSLARSKVINSIENLTILNAKYPSRDYIKSVLLKAMRGVVVQDNVITYIANNVRFDISKLPEVIDNIIESGLKEVNLTDIKKILPPSKTENLRVLVYTMLLSNLPELKSNWNSPDKDIRMLSKNAGTKVKPFKILNSVELPPDVTLSIILRVLTEMSKIKGLVLKGKLSITNVFDKKEKLELPYPFLKKMTIPQIREYITVSSEITVNELEYFIYEFSELLTKIPLTENDIYFKVHQLMERYN